MECTDPRGLRNLPGGWKTGDKRRQDKSKKIRKLKYETMPEDWGCGEVDMMEEEEIARGEFLKGGETSQLRDSANKQTTIRIWSRQELLSTSLEEDIRNVKLKPEPKQY